MANTNVGSIPRLGYKITTDYQDNLLGAHFEFSDVVISSENEMVQSGMPVEAVWVKNVGATALPAGAMVTWSAVGTTVSGLAGATDMPAGAVDPNVSSSVAQYERFLLIVKGPTKLISGASFSAGDRIKTTTSGKAITNPLSTVAELSCGVGRAIEAATAGDQLKRVLVDFQTY